MFLAFRTKLIVVQTMELPAKTAATYRPSKCNMDGVHKEC